MKNDYKPIEELLIQDHNNVKMLFEKYKSCSSKDESVKYFNQICWELARHEVAEELVLYPVIRERVSNGKLLADEAFADEDKVKLDLNNLNSIDIKNIDFDIKFKSIFENILRHMDKEENIYLPNFIQSVSLDERIKMGKKFENRKLIAPTRPHPSDLEKYPFLQTIQGVLLAPLDKFMDLFKSFPEEPIDTLKLTS